MSLFVLSLFFTSALAAPFDGVTKSDILNFLKSLNDQGKTLSGQHEGLGSQGKFVQYIQDKTGKTPAWIGGDWGYQYNPENSRQQMTDYLIQKWNQGSLVHLSWHVCRPDWGDGNCCFGYGEGSYCNGNNAISKSYNTLSSQQWSELVSQSGTTWDQYKKLLDSIIPYLKQMTQVGVVPVFRLHHELNMAWAWWQNQQNPKNTAQLWENGIKYIESQVGSDKIIWLWNMQDDYTMSWSSYLPYDQSIVDACGLDVWDADPYGKDCGQSSLPSIPASSYYQSLRSVCGHQPLGLGEVGLVPKIDILKNQHWAWFMVWSDFIYDCYNGEGENPVHRMSSICIKIEVESS
jgi:mannan endo-1,4-beta-mannosidase